MQGQDSVKVTNEALETHGEVGRVVCAGPFDVDGVPHVDVVLDLDDTRAVREFAVADLMVL